jgi:hypothetical protein
LYRDPEHAPADQDDPCWQRCNGDGHNDIVLGGRIDSVIVLFGNGKGGIRGSAMAFKTRQRMPGYVAAADFNTDERPDLVVTYFENDAIDVYLSR